MKIASVKVNNFNLLLPAHATSTDSYKLFMEYCIDNYEDRIRRSKILKTWFKVDLADTDVEQKVREGKMVEHAGIYYSIHNSTIQKKKIIEDIADILDVPLYIMTYED